MPARRSYSSSGEPYASVPSTLALSLSVRRVTVAVVSPAGTPLALLLCEGELELSSTAAATAAITRTRAPARSRRPRRLRPCWPAAAAAAAGAGVGAPGASSAVTACAPSREPSAATGSTGAEPACAGGAVGSGTGDRDRDWRGHPSGLQLAGAMERFAPLSPCPLSPLGISGGRPCPNFPFAPPEQFEHSSCAFWKAGFRGWVRLRLTSSFMSRTRNRNIN